MELKNLVVGYHKPLIHDINAHARAGELVCIVGKNGTGKSTLLRVLAGIQQPLHGWSTPLFATEVALVITHNTLPFTMTVQDIITFGRYPFLNRFLQLTNEDNEIIENVLQKTGLHTLADTTWEKLSDGQKQITLIARAWAQNTPYIFCDEPTLFLDAENRQTVMTIFHQLTREENKSVLMTSHETDVWLQADTLWLLENKKISVGLPEDFLLAGKLHSPTHAIEDASSFTLHAPEAEKKWITHALQKNKFTSSSPITFTRLSKEKFQLEWNGQSFDSIASFLSFTSKN